MVVAASLSGDPTAALFGSERDGKVVLQGADVRGTIYAIYTFSEIFRLNNPLGLNSRNAIRMPKAIASL